MIIGLCFYDMKLLWPAVWAVIMMGNYWPGGQANLINDPAALWPRHVVPFEFGETLNELQIMQLKGLFFLFHAQTCVRFVAHRREPDYLVIETDEWRTLLPPVGRKGGRQVLTFTAKDFDGTRVIVRDLMRALGFYYEVQRPDRFMFVDVRFKDIFAKDWGKFRVIAAENIDLLSESYDYNSATHFAPQEYASGIAPAFTILAPNQQTGQEKGLSEIDVRRLNKAYKCSLMVSDNALCPDKWISGLDGKCYYFSSLDPDGRSTSGPARRACEQRMGIPLVMTELSSPSRGFLLDILRHTRSEPIWVTGSTPTRELRAERDNRCSILDTMNNVRSVDDQVDCEGTLRNYVCQRTAANECWYVRDNPFDNYRDCSR